MNALLLTARRCAGLLGLLGSVAQAQPIAPAPGAGYVRSDGSVQIICAADLRGVTEQLGAEFTRRHPGTRFAVLPANDLAALQSLAFDASACAPVGTDVLGGAAVAYGALVHAEPFSIRIAHGSLDPQAAIAAIAVIAHPSNPLAQLSVDQVARIFTEPMRKSNFTRWSQLGIKGPLAAEGIHPYGPAWSEHFLSEDPSFSDWMFQRKLGGGPPVAGYVMVDSYDRVGEKVAADPLAIGLIALNRVPRGVKVVGLVGNPWGAPSVGSAADLQAGRYAFDRYVNIFVRRVPGRPFDPLVREYLRLALSPEGQRAIAADARHYLPLNPVEVGEELAKLQ
jgi:phosphate transport system substrate-binding protein